MDKAKEILDASLLIDLETSVEGKILKVGAVCGDREGRLQGRFSAADVARMLGDVGSGARFLVGHNILEHDLPILGKHCRRLAQLRLPAIDTLFLSPLAFPENPYHRLLKDYRLLETALNDPVSDARNAGKLLADECAALGALAAEAPGLAAFYAWGFANAMSAFFQALETAPLPTRQARRFFEEEAGRRGCATVARRLGRELARAKKREPWAYALAWLRVAGANSIVPLWVRMRFPEVATIVRKLRDTGCSDPNCSYCVENRDPVRQLRRFFGFEGFRPEPRAPDGGSLQEQIVRAGMAGEPLLAILPTGGGKSVCFQLPALAHNYRTGALSVVISPLQALMKDQVDNLNRQTQSGFAAALYGMLTPPERGDVIERVRMGDVAILYVSPEQLRNSSFRNMIKSREIACWVFDEAHCLSRWGHSFRPDYLYASRFIRELAEAQGVERPPVACFTATAKRDVIEEIRSHFREELGQELRLFDGGAARTNLAFEVQMVHAAEKRGRVLELLRERLPKPEDGASVVYCATRAATEEMARWLQRAGLAAEAFHAGLDAPEKRRIQEEFVAGTIQHICATNAFGMGIDKDNVRLVIHADIPGSLENYLQEAGRAGRDRNPAQCVLLYDKEDVETQFALGAFSRLTRHDIAQILRGLRRARRNDRDAVVITTGEILRDEEVETEFGTDDPMAATKVGTAVSMLERGRFVRRDENRTRVLQVQPLVRSIDEAVGKIRGLGLSARRQRQWLEILGAIYNCEPARGISADDLAELPSMASETAPPEKGRGLRHDTLPVIRVLNDMVNAQILKKDSLMSAFVKVRCANASEKVFREICRLEMAMVDLLREEEPDAEGWLLVGLRRLNQRLLDQDFSCTPDTLVRLLRSLSLDGQGLAGNRGSIELKYRNQEYYRVKLNRSWDALKETAHRRQAVAGVVLRAIASKVPAGSSGEHLVEFAESDLVSALRSDMLVAAQVRDFGAALERGLLFLHEQKAIILQQGLAVFRQAMTITILPESRGRGFTAGDYSPLREHYLERNFQIHVMNRYATLGLEGIKEAMELVAAYFTMGKRAFVKRFFDGEKTMLERATSAESYRRIVDSLNNPVQVAVVSARPDANMLVLAGPGSGKTRAIAHRCAYLLRVERVRPREILVVCFNHSAAVSLRRRIRDLVGRSASGVTVQTYHGLAMRLLGASLSARMDASGEMPDLDTLIPAATRMLRGECGIPGVERDEMRELLLSGYRYILIDEYQDINAEQYEMVSAIAGRTLDSKNEEARLSILAVGDDDQNIYTFLGANIHFIRRFEKDYRASVHYLVENYRSTAHIIAVSNRLISRNRDRMKGRNPIRVNEGRRGDPPGDPVRAVACADAVHQARHLLETIRQWRKAGGSIAVFARTRRELHAVRGALEYASIPFVVAEDGKRGGPPLHRLREARALIEMLQSLEQATIVARQVRERFQTLEIHEEGNPWVALLDAILGEWEEVTANQGRPPAEVVDYLYESLHERRRDGTAGEGVYLSTVHAAKGLEFDRVALLGYWPQAGKPSGAEEERRLYYVGMTRARTDLLLYNRADAPNPHLRGLDGEGLVRETAGRFQEPPEEVLRLEYAHIGLSGVWIDYPAFSPSIRQAVARLRPGDAVALEPGDGRIFVRDRDGRRVGALSNAASEAWKEKLPRVKEVRVHSIVEWRRDLQKDAAPAADDGPERWEVALFDVVLGAGELGL